MVAEAPTALHPEMWAAWYRAGRAVVRGLGGLWQGKIVVPYEYGGAKQMLVFPEPHQEAFLHSKERHPAFVAGRGTGKTWTGLVKMVLFILGNPGAKTAITAETYPQIEDIILPAMDELFGPWKGVLWSYHVAAREIRWANGCVTLLLPAAEPDKLVGLTLAAFMMEEAKVGHQEMAFLMLIPCLRQAGYPHQGWITTTPLGPNHWISLNWIKHVLGNGKELPAADYPVYSATMYDNMALDPKTKEALETRFGGTKLAQRELMGRVVALEGQAFENFGEIHIRSMPVGMKVKRYLNGLDVGSVAPTASHRVTLGENGKIWISHEFYKRRCDLGDLAEVLGERGGDVICDPNGKDEIEYLRKLGIPARKAPFNGFDLRYQLVSSRLALGPDHEPGMYIDPSCVELINELQTLAFATPRGMTDGAPRWETGCNDHAYDDVAYALMVLEGSGKQGRPQGTKIRRFGHTYN